MTTPESVAVPPVLDLPDRVAEVLFGLIMALTFTGTIQVSVAGRDEVETVLVAAIGCNLAWGLVDGVMYLVQALVDRGRKLASLHALAAARNEAELRTILAEAVPSRIVERLRVDDLDGLRELAAEYGATARARLTLADLRAALLVSGLVVVATFPVVVPYFVFDDLEAGKRVSNAVSIVLLYVCGHVLAHYAGGRPVRTGLAMVAIGVVLVLTIIALGG